MSEHREEHLELCAAYAVGNIDLADRHRLGEHLALGCTECETALGDYGAATLLLAASAPSEPPTARLRQRVLAAAGVGVMEEPPPTETASAPATEVKASRHAPRDESDFASAMPEPRAARAPSAASASSTAPSRPRPPGGAVPRPAPRPAGARPRPAGSRPAAGGLGSLPSLTRLRRPGGLAINLTPTPMLMIAGGLGLLALILLIVTINLAGALGSAKKELSSNLEAMTSINLRLQDAQVWSEVMTSPAGRTATLVPTDGSVGGRGRVTFDPTTRHAVLVFSGLQAPRGHVLELWSVASNGPSSLGMIQTDTFGRAIVHIEDAGDPNDLTGFVVSLESPGDTRRRRDPSRVVMAGRIEG